MLVASAFVIAALSGVPAEAFRLAPYKDEHFAYANVVGSQHNGDFVMIEFNEERDINGRDEIPLKKAWDKMVNLDVNQYKQDLVLNAGRNSTKYLAVGKVDGGEVGEAAVGRRQHDGFVRR